LVFSSICNGFIMVFSAIFCHYKDFIACSKLRQGLNVELNCSHVGWANVLLFAHHLSFQNSILECLPLSEASNL